VWHRWGKALRYELIRTFSSQKSAPAKRPSHGLCPKKGGRSLPERDSPIKRGSGSQGVADLRKTFSALVGQSRGGEKPGLCLTLSRGPLDSEQT